MDNIIEYLYSVYLKCEGISIDTRTIHKGNLFFALKGPNFNANEYAKGALEKGAAYAVVDDPYFANSDQYILVPEVLRSLQDLSVLHRKKLSAKIFGLTGSNGKTTTKELLVRVLGKKYKTRGTKGNLNNHIGVPLSLLSITEDIEMAVIEMGANKIGDIAELCSFASPDYGLITNIGEAHTEGFGGMEGVIRGKSELFDHLRKNNGVAFINLEDPVLSNMAKRFGHPVTYPSPDVSLLSANPMITFQLGKEVVFSELIGAYNFQNIAAAVSVGRYFGVEDVDIAAAISAYIPSNQRSQIIKKDGLNIIMDAYNANPSSMKAALENLLLIPGPKHIILGDMKEMEDPKATHNQLGTQLNNLELETILLVGPEMKYAAEKSKQATWFRDIESINQYLYSHPITEGHVLIKGSRSMRLEKVLEILT